jgi:hypothetical protein
MRQPKSMINTYPCELPHRERGDTQHSEPRTQNRPQDSELRTQNRTQDKALSTHNFYREEIP